MERLYRAAALSYADQGYMRAMGCGILAAVVDPSYTLRRAYRQRLSAGARESLRSSQGMPDGTGS